MKQLRILSLLVVAVLLLALAACGQEAPTEEDAPEPLAADAFMITMEPAGHWHVFSPKTLLFNVTDATSGEGVADLDLTVQIAQADSDRVTERSVSEGDVSDEGDGLYALEYTPSSIGSYSIAAAFVKDSQHFASAPAALEISKAGEEGIKATVDGIDYVYQIRYHFEPGHIHANDSEPAKMVFELMRGIEVGNAINWEQPWTNSFDHVNALDTAEIMLMSEDGAVSEVVPVTYKGQGVWEAERIFTEAEVGEGQEYTIHCSFIDSLNGAEIEHEEPFPLHASAAH